VLHGGFWSSISPSSGVEGGGADGGLVEVRETRLLQNIPNPFNPVTTIQYSVAKEGPVDLTIFSVAGERVRTVVNHYHYPGLFSAVWDGRDEQGETVSSGVYFYRMTAGEYSGVRKMLVLK
jgi:flagellar hook assembly protein FlgD